ncbi:MAG TPA: glycoside hydrolase family 43 protein, partial [Pyrinomonadaceae bacterium]|nr:glycoside hydrolase family 43 protein [Pyrinomonadaceae bacterium]
SYENGKFLMYYSVGNEKLMHVRVAVADDPAGPFTDSGHRLTDAVFAIDPHVFVDEDDTRWLFYATDFLTHTHIGTGTVCDRMLDQFTLAGEPRPVTRARYDWQVYDPARKEKGGVRWHTVEGPFVLRRKNLYYQMFSGGNWQNLTYGVSYAVSDRIERGDEWEQAADGERVLPILRTIPEKVVGPGHNSVVRGTNNRELFCVYHRWDGERGRVLAIDRLDWVGERMTVLGASTTPQPAPLPPTFQGFAGYDGADGLGEGWTPAGGRWELREGEARQESTEEGEASARSEAGASSFLLEVSLRALGTSAKGAFGVALSGDGGGRALEFLIEPGANAARLSWRAGDGENAERRFALPADFETRAFHLLRVEVDGARATISLDERVARWQGNLSIAPSSVALVTRGASAGFKGFELTVGWEELFTQPERTLRSRGWQGVGEGDGWLLRDDLLRFENLEGSNRAITRAPLLESYELVVNARLERKPLRGVGRYGFYPAYVTDEHEPLLTVEREGVSDRWALLARSLGNASIVAGWPLPESFDPLQMQQFRFRKQKGRLAIQWESLPLGEINTTTEAAGVGLYAHRAHVAFDMVRVTAIKP